jgi:hypothetical protein
MFRYSLNFKNLLINAMKTNYDVRNYSSARFAKERRIENSAIRRSLKCKTEIPAVYYPNSKVLMYNGLFVIFCSFCSAGVYYYIDNKFSSFEKDTNEKFRRFANNTIYKFSDIASFEKNINYEFINLEKNTNDKFANLEKNITGLERITNDKITNIENIQSKNVKPEAVVKWW